MRRILLIDDEPDIRAVARLAIEVVAGWECVEAESGLAGLDVARASAPDAVLIDVMMPGLDGFATASAFRSDTELCGLPLVLLTAKTLDDNVEWLVDGVLAKPFDPMTLGKDIARILGWDA
ncbi:MAG: response regulator [Demequinaceae bacterium]|nr:response regulator [Demequinaceae bacterium]